MRKLSKKFYESLRPELLRPVVGAVAIFKKYVIKRKKTNQMGSKQDFLHCSMVSFLVLFARNASLNFFWIFLGCFVISSYRVYCWMAVVSQSIASVRPYPVVALVLKTAHPLFFMLASPRVSDTYFDWKPPPMRTFQGAKGTSTSERAPFWSCLLAKTRIGTPFISGSWDSSKQIVTIHSQTQHISTGTKSNNALELSG